MKHNIEFHLDLADPFFKHVAKDLNSIRHYSYSFPDFHRNLLLAFYASVEKELLLSKNFRSIDYKDIPKQDSTKELYVFIYKDYSYFHEVFKDKLEKTFPTMGYDLIHMIVDKVDDSIKNYHTLQNHVIKDSSLKTRKVKT